MTENRDNQIEFQNLVNRTHKIVPVEFAGLRFTLAVDFFSLHDGRKKNIFYEICRLGTRFRYHTDKNFHEIFYEFVLIKQK